MPALRRVTPADRRARLAVRHLLHPAARAGRTEDVAEALVGLHATDAATVTLSACARLAVPAPADVDRALYEDRTLLRMHCMRRTLFVVPAELVPVFFHAAPKAMAERERATLLRHLAAADPARDDRWLDDTAAKALTVLAGLGEASAPELTEAVPELQTTITLSPGKHYASTLRIGGELLRLLAMEGKVRRGRPVGGWTSSRFRYHPAPGLPHLDPADAQADLVRRWLAAYGPGTEADLKWWTGWSLREVRRALERIAPEQVDLGEAGPGWDLDPRTPDEVTPWAAFLPGLDPATMGWRHRDFSLDPDHRPLLFDTAGNGGPTIWLDGRIVGTWAQRPTGEVVRRLFTDPGADGAALVDDAQNGLQTLLDQGELRVNFPAPLTKELLA
ncbi:AlkZ family DNA glycosylase [Streptomyces sp. TRM66268-LWL]|uniref:AlkZ family DNA glycosylase n=1 Tax=Streptomyces polyasparticus TaxID=2767826 RepID=A0ABR7SU59_9ACTN|nr:winged helix DNA-binding domain-containing protein [Streptomyces polyasparticus]MBC9719011.1 AlkZ family DNA glycosylase [Streptomyces polyasparticus]